ncbi:hypothetical protein FGE12_26020 [Aggregicoccus sp. 17bor-14]|uniref:hypothetical protein n=1 Tax=Myxococcaceae TaxID=31 RepID=UPI00129C41C7|nr:MULTISPECIES: hypothetical protein [Myxococcaceae]MBF5045894.1 hypothetical protein [Simulacricoccus sp. 17bor-14]MRI91628.1 hypothetical protein [Aggregicoccus sp. 17bor-14]
MRRLCARLLPLCGLALLAVPMQAAARQRAPPPAPAAAPLSSSASAPKPPPLWGALVPGRYGVGFRSLALRDPARPLPGGAGARPLQVGLWYPTALPAHGGRALHYGDLVGLSGREQHPEKADAAAERKALAAYRTLLTSNGIPASAAATWMNAPLAGRRDAPVAPGRFPLVLVAQGNFQSAQDQVVLCEYLASHGYLVATTPSPMRLTGPMKSDAEVLPAAKAQAADLAFALSALRAGAAPVDPEAGVALVGHSFGARAAFLLALREDLHPAALVSLDGGIANASGKDWLRGLEGFQPARFSVPVLHLYQQGDEVVQPDFTLLRSLVGSERTLARVGGMRHMDFGSVGAASGVVPALGAGGKGQGARGYAASVQLSLRFLDAALHRGPEAAEELKKALKDPALTKVERWPVGSRSDGADGGSGAQ